MTSNEIRQIIGMKPANDPKADMLVNSNINQSPEELALSENSQTNPLNADPSQMTDEQIEQTLAALDQNDEELDALESELDSM